jgi:hypothetical protein
VDACDVRIGDERDRSVTGNELAEPLQGAVLHVDPGGGKDDVVGIPGDNVSDFGVDRPPLLVEALELLVASGERTAASFHALPGNVDVDVDPDHRRVLLEQRAHLGCRDRATAEIYDDRLGALEHVAGDLGLSRTKRRLALLEQLERDVRVGLHVRQAQRPGDRRLAGAHEADEREVLV